MRLAAQVKLGFYAAHEDAVAAIAAHLERETLPEGSTREFAILDPCAGEGLALRQLAAHLAIPPAQTYAVELDAGRAATIRENIPGARVLGPASFMGTKVTAGSFSVAYVNPPFDDELGGGQRQEMTFAIRATTALKARGVLVLVMPITAIRSNTRFKEFLDSHYHDAAVYDFPAHVRPFREIVYIAKKRRVEMADNERFLQYLPLNSASEGVGNAIDDGRLWDAPWCHPPAAFHKVELTLPELEREVDHSPLNRLLAPPTPDNQRRPPADLSTGHVALLLASGLLDGTIHPPDEEPHVVRGTARKEDYRSKAPVSNVNEKGSLVSITEVFSQKIVLTVRGVGPDGKIHTFTDSAGETLEAEDAA